MAYCNWGHVNELEEEYHNTEWGVPVTEDRKQFEHLMMEVMQCGLSWNLMLVKREIFRACFAGFDYEKVAAFGEKDVERILNYEGMIRSRQKILAVIGNARHFLEIRKEFGSFTNYISCFTGGKTILYKGHDKGWIPASNGLSARIAKDLKRRGFKYLGPVTVYSHLQASGVINDHDRHCPCYQKINKLRPTEKREPDEERNVIYFGED